MLDELIKTSIDLIRSYETSQGYSVEWSGGVDSQAALSLVREAGVKHEVFHRVTGIDAPETMSFIRQHAKEYGVNFTYPKRSFTAGVIQNGLPTRRFRWCCELLKEYGGKGRVVITGIRHDESDKRSARNCQEPARTGNGHFVHPIFRWSRIDKVKDGKVIHEGDVWEYIKSRNIPYCSLYDEGFSRIGCVMCPQGNNKRYRDMLRWPKMAAVWYRAGYQYWLKQTPSMQRFKTYDDYWGWWLANKRYQPRLIGGDVVKPAAPNMEGE